MFAALNTMEPPIAQLVEVDLFHAEEAWAKERRPGVVQAVGQRLDELAAYLEGREWLLDRFTAGDLMMVAVLRILRHTDLVEQRPALLAYRKRGEERPAHLRAVAAQLADFADEPAA
jgi:glutathione S-transferase